MATFFLSWGNRLNHEFSYSEVFSNSSSTAAERRGQMCVYCFHHCSFGFSWGRLGIIDHFRSWFSLGMGFLCLHDCTWKCRGVQIHQDFLQGLLYLHHIVNSLVHAFLWGILLLLLAGVYTYVVYSTQKFCSVLLTVSGLHAGVWSGRLFPTVVFTENAGPTVAKLLGCNRQLPVCHLVPANETRWAPVCTEYISLLRMDSSWALLS